MSKQTSTAKASASAPAAATGRSVSDFGGPRRRVVMTFPAETLTEQHHKAACDINNIMARYTKTGVLDHVRRFEPVYSDLMPDEYHESMNKVAEAKSMFEELPSAVRRHFGDDVSQFLEFCADTPNAAGELQGIAEEYRRHSLGLDQAASEEAAKKPETGNSPPAREGGQATAQDGGMDTPSEGTAEA